MQSPPGRRRRVGAPLAAGAVLVAIAACSNTSAGSGAAERKRTPETTVPTERSTAANGVAPAPTVVVKRVANLPRGSARAVLVADRGHLLLLGGLDASRNTTREILRVDLPGGAVTNAGALAVPVHDSAGAVVAGRATLFGGGNSSETAVVQALGTDGTVREIGRLPVARSDLTAATVAGRVYLIGGYDGARVRATTIATTDGTSFQLLGDLPTPVRYAAVAPLGRDVYVIGGTTTGTAGGAVRAVQALDTTTGATRTVGDLVFPLTDAVATTLGGRVYVIGGIAGGAPSNRIWRLDLPATPGRGVAMVPVATLPVPLTDAALAVAHGVAYVAGGESPALSSAVFSVEVR